MCVCVREYMYVCEYIVIHTCSISRRIRISSALTKLIATPVSVRAWQRRVWVLWRIWVGVTSHIMWVMWDIWVELILICHMSICHMWDMSISHIWDSYISHDELHEKLLRIRRVSTPSNSIHTGSLEIGFAERIQNAGFARVNGTNQTKEGHRGRKPVSKKLRGRNKSRMSMSDIEYKIMWVMWDIWVSYVTYTHVVLTCDLYSYVITHTHM